MKKYPLKLSYIAKSAIWGGTTLRDEWGKRTDGDNIAEIWALSVREKEMAVVENGEAAGLTLREYFERVGFDCVSKTFGSDERFPLLVKLIDAAAPLSVQVHPDDAYASAAHGDSGKTEVWYVLDAKEGAELVCGLADGVDAEGFRRAVAEGRISDALCRVKVKAGDCFFIPAGMVHAIGEGILIAEIQQNSDLTYRVYDYDRLGADGKPRELHTERALDVVRPFDESEVDAIRFSRGRGEGMLVDSDYFRVRRIAVDGTDTLTVGDGSFCSLLCVDGAGALEFDGERYELQKGDCYFLPRALGKVTLSGSLELICSEI